MTSREHGSALVISESPAFLRPNVSLLTPASQVRVYWRHIHSPICPRARESAIVPDIFCVLTCVLCGGVDA